MNHFFSFLLVACVCISMVIATSESNDHHVIISKHLTSAAHSFRTMQSSIPGVSDICIASTDALESNSAIKAANASVIAYGCTDAKQQTCDALTRTCTCITSFSNDANLRSLVTQAGGQVCSLSMVFTANTNENINVNFNYQGFPGALTIVGPSCATTDIRSMLSVLMDAFAQGIRQGGSSSSSSSSSSIKILSITGTFSLCGTSYTGTRVTSGAYNNQPVAIAITLLIGIIIAIINQAL